MKKAIYFLMLLFSDNCFSLDQNQTIMISHASSDICIIYSMDINRDHQKYSELRQLSLTLADQYGLSKSLPECLLSVREMRNILNSELIKKYGTKENILNKWCPQLIEGYQQ